MHYVRIAFIPILVIIFVSIFWVQKNKMILPDKFIQEKKDIDTLIVASIELNKIWTTGVVTKFDSYDSDKECNPHFMEHYFEYLDSKKFPHLKVMIDGVERIINLQKIYSRAGNNTREKQYYKILDRLRWNIVDIENYAIMVTLKVNDYQMEIVLEDSCHEIYLPRRIYAKGPKGDDYRKDKLWNNFSENIFVDRYLVTNQDILDWQENSLNQDKSILGKVDRNNLSRPSTNLTFVERELFCKSRGKILMDSDVFDAASFHPDNYENPRPAIVIRSPYPWSRKTKNTFLYKMQNGPKEEDLDKLKGEYCKKVYAKECLSLLDESYVLLTSVTWIGMFNALGGYMESVKNVDNHKLNLKLSSFYFPMHSNVHQIGIRGSWNGEGFTFRDFDFSDYEKELLDEKSVFFKVGFRCMRNKK